MSYAKFQKEISNQEFELWIALASVRSEECPSCGRSAREMMKWTTTEVTCVICTHKYQRVMSTSR